MNIPYKLVDCYSSNIVNELEGCDVLLWQHHHISPKDVLFAKQLLFSLEQGGKIVFPDFKTGWHFDDKVGQKYLFENLNLPLVNNTSYPKVWKLRGGAGATNVRLLKSKSQTLKLINKAFGKGFSQYSALRSLKERWRQFVNSKKEFLEVLKGVGRLFIPPFYAKVMGKEVGYIYFQEFIPNNDSDIRIIVIDGKAFGLKRMVRKGDFRASGSGDFYNKREDIDERCVKIAFETTEKLDSKSAVYDFVFDKNNTPLIVEVSYGFSVKAYDSCPGYWDKDLTWYEGQFNPYGWIIQSVINEVEMKRVL
jgi:hypothetical protein